MCSSREIVETESLPGSESWATNTAWVRQSPQIAFQAIVVDSTGATGLASCLGWSSADSEQLGFVVSRGADFEGRFGSLTCNTGNVGVACCH